MQGTPVFYIWAGLTFELLALNHIDQIKSKLSIKGVNTIEYAWRSSGLEHGAQIDLVIDRADNTINLLQVGSWYFGQYPITLPEGAGTYNPQTGDIELNLDFDGDPFYVKLTK